MVIEVEFSVHHQYAAQDAPSITMPHLVQPANVMEMVVMVVAILVEFFARHQDVEQDAPLTTMLSHAPPVNAMEEVEVVVEVMVLVVPNVQHPDVTWVAP